MAYKMGSGGIQTKIEKATRQIRYQHPKIVSEQFPHKFYSTQPSQILFILKWLWSTGQYMLLTEAEDVSF